MKAEKDFYTHLMVKFMKDNPHYLDDDYPDVFDDWISEQDVEYVIECAEEYANQIRKELSHDTQRA